MDNTLDNTKLKPARNSSIELLRIISMVMITFHHFACHGGFDWQAADATIPHFWYNFIVMGGKIGVDIFILISGYFLISNNDSIFNIKRILKFWGQVVFYSVAIFIIFCALGISDFGIKPLIKTFFPITFSSWWFASTYFVLFIIHPFLNKLLNGLNQKNYQSLLVMLVILWSLLPTLTNLEYQGNSLTWFITLYAIAGYARLYGFNKKFSSKHYFIFGLIFSILTYSTSAVFTIMGSKWNIFIRITYFYDQEKISVLLISLSLFMAFATLKINHNKWINIIASAAFGVYLIHDSNIIRPFLWLEVFKNAQHQDSLLLIPYSIVVVAIVYIVCTVIDLIRQRVIEKPYMILVNRYSDCILKPFTKICNFFRDIIFG
jgi:hypothetical protein